MIYLILHNKNTSFFVQFRQFFFHSSIVLAAINSLSVLISPSDAQTGILRHKRIKTKLISGCFGKGASINSWLCPRYVSGFPTSLSVVPFVGFYRQITLKAKFCPFIPDAINAIKIDDGPTSGTTLMPFSCAAHHFGAGVGKGG